MLKDIAKLKLRGGIFDTDTILPIFEKKKSNGPKMGEAYRTQGAIVYGRNGSGKSTLSNAFLSIKNGSFPGIEAAQLLNLEGKPITMTQEEKHRIYVFNEEFTDKNVKTDKKGMDTIVMLGPAIGQDEEIKKAKNDLTKAEECLKKAKEEKDKYEEKDGDKNPDIFLNKVKEILKEKDGWVERAQKYDDTVRVTENVLKEISGLTFTETHIEVENAFSKKCKEYLQAKSGESKLEGVIQQITYTYDENAIINLLGKKVEKPELTEREQWLIELGIDDINDRKAVFSKEETDRCPYCGREVDATFKTELIKSLNKKLGKDVEDHITNLETQMRNVRGIIDALNSMQLKTFNTLPEYKNCQTLIATNLSIATEVATKIEAKKNTPYVAIIMQITELDKCLMDLNASLVQLKKEKDDHNKKVSDIVSITNSLKELNKKIAYYEIKPAYDDYKKALDTKDKALKDYESKEKEKLACEKKIAELEKKKDASKPDIAVDIINEYLEYIFVSDERLEIKYDPVDKVYKLLSRGHSINPKQASVGERNIISLCYFFASIMEGKEKNDKHKEECLFVIDDPISSFDVGNKVGLMSFVKMMLNIYTTGNKETSFIITTHDIKTAYDLDAAFSEIRDTRDDWNYNKYEIQDKSFKAFSDKRNEYSELLRITFMYANSSIDDPVAQTYDIFIGNIMRQVLESYATFTYGLGMSQLTTDKHAQVDIPTEYRKYFTNRMYRLLLNGGSHKLEDIKANDDSTYYSKMTLEEKHAVARDVICLLYEMNAGHLYAHLKGSKTDYDNIIKPWVEALPKEKQ